MLHTNEPWVTAPRPIATEVPRAIGALDVQSKQRGNLSCLEDFRCSGALRALFPRSQSRLEAIMINTSGGLTSGDRLSLKSRAGAGSHLTLTTQAAERAYRAEGSVAKIVASLQVDADACLHWLPQEMILFDHCALERSMDIDLAPSAQLLFVEPVIFGRSAMGETVETGHFSDRVRISRDGQPLYMDAIRLTGQIRAQLAATAVARGACAMASLVYVAPDAEAQLKPVRGLLPKTAGASLLQPDVLVLRCLAVDGFELRQSLLPVLDRLSQNTLPKSWRL
ncbi:urease accessory protein UreD [Rhodobacteraceae bacterium]|nr:urease accessory protein UreD [Paracoccaceae bacterium]